MTCFFTSGYKGQVTGKPCLRLEVIQYVQWLPF